MCASAPQPRDFWLHRWLLLRAAMCTTGCPTGLDADRAYAQAVCESAKCRVQATAQGRCGKREHLPYVRSSVRVDAETRRYHTLETGASRDGSVGALDYL